MLGNGSNEIIELLFHTFTRPGIHDIITARHAFAVYTLMAQLFGVRAITVDDIDFKPRPARHAARGDAADAAHLPRLAQQPDRHARDQRRPRGSSWENLPPHVIAVLDEAYYEFLDDAPDTVGHMKSSARVVLMRTFSKIQGLAGLRIGYGLAPAEIADLLQRARQPFNANAIAQAGAIAGLADVEHQRKTKAITDEGRKVLEDAFAAMELTYVPSSANFVLVHVGDGGEVFKRLLKKGIIVRSMVSYHLPAYIRVSIGTPEQNARFLAELPAALEGLVSFKSLEVAVALRATEELPVDASRQESVARSATATEEPAAQNPPDHPVSPPDPVPEPVPERVPVPDPAPNPDHEPATPDPAPEPEPQPEPEPTTAAAEPESSDVVVRRLTATDASSPAMP